MAPITSRENRINEKQVARKPSDAAAVLFGLKFADNIHYKLVKLRKPAGFRAPNVAGQKQFNVKWSFKVWESVERQ